MSYFPIKSTYIGIPKIYGYFINSKKLTIITEYFPNGNLFQFYSKLNEKSPNYISLWNDTMKSKLAFGIACTMMHIQSSRVMHGYLSPLTIYFDNEYNPKTCDYAYFPTFYLKDDIEFGPHNLAESPYYCPVFKQTYC